MGVDPIDWSKSPISHGATSWVEFLGDNGPKNCLMVHDKMHSENMTFQQACDYLEMRPNYHYVVMNGKPDGPTY